MTRATEPTEIILRDGVKRHLEYTMRDTKVIKGKWGATHAQMFRHANEDLLPEVIWTGLIEKDGLTRDGIEDLITGEDADYVTLCFVQAFFGLRVRLGFEAALANQDKILAALENMMPRQTIGSEPGPSPLHDTASA
jgi:hypothetical protein